MEVRDCKNQGRIDHKLAIIKGENMKDNLIIKSGNKNDVKKDVSKEKEKKLPFASRGGAKNEKG